MNRRDYLELRKEFDAKFIAGLPDAVKLSRADFPSSDAALAALTEELGEVARAMLDEDDERVWAECLQLAATALRLAVEGDPAMASTRKRRRGERDWGGALA